MIRTPAADGTGLAHLEAGQPEDRVPLQTFEGIVRGRRSVYGYLEHGIPRQLIEHAIRLAVLAPNHHRTHPWRFHVFTQAGRERLARAYQAAATRLGRDVARARARALDAPVMIVVACVPDLRNPKVRAAEESFATAAAVQTLLLALAASGLASLISTGDLAQSEEVHRLIGLAPEAGQVVAVVNAGHADPARPPARRPETDPASYLSWCEQP